MQFFYTTQFEDGIARLDPEESRHALKVLRLKAGDTVEVVDGQGRYYSGKLIYNDLKDCRVEIVKCIENYRLRNHYLHMAVAPTKNISRFEWFLEKATEIGIDEITPLICSRSERKSVNIDRMQKILITAMKQSLKAYLPKLNEVCRITDTISSSFEGEKYIAHCGANYNNLKQVYPPNASALIMIGPEGDFTNEEIERSVQKGFRPISLGESRLRTETAAVVACHTVNLLNQ